MSRNRARIWDRYLSNSDRRVLEASGYGASGDFGERPALIVVDVTYGFCGDAAEPLLDSIKRWPQSCGAAAWDALPAINSMISTARRVNIPVIYTCGHFRADGWDMGSWLWKNDNTDHILSKSLAEIGGGVRPEFNDILKEVAPSPADIIIYKQKPSGFHDTPLATYLSLLKRDSVVIVGTTTSGCVRATAVDAFSRNFRTVIVEDACFDRFEASHAIALFDMDAKYADVLESTEVARHLENIRSEDFDFRLKKRE